MTGPLAGLCALALRAGRWVVRQLVALPVGLAGRVVPRDPALWAFGSTSGRRFADNPKHLFLHCHSADGPGPKVRAVWLSQNRDVVRAVRALGLPAEHCWHPRGLWTALRAGVYLFDCRALDVHPSAGHGAFKVNLWHGVPLKKIECDIEQADHPIVAMFSAASASSRCGIIGSPYCCEGGLSRHPEMKVIARTATLSTITAREMVAPKI